jgi:hypothetical protein
MLKEIPESVGAMKEARLLLYDTQTYQFSEIISKILNCSTLNKLHVKEYLKNKDDAVTESRVFSFDYNMMLRQKLKNIGDAHPFYKLFHTWVQNEFCKEFGNKISYNSHPTFRVHMAGTPSVSAWHTDYEVTGRKDQITVWVPITNAFDSNTIHVETDYGKGDYKPVNVNYGEALLFDGNCLSHGSISNHTNFTRVSFDFRFTPKREVLENFFKRFNSTQ